MVRPTVERLREAATQALSLEGLLNDCMAEGLLPVLVGFDLDYVARLFEQAAEKLAQEA